MKFAGRGLFVALAVVVAGTLASRDASAQPAQTAQTEPAGPWSVQYDLGLTVGNTTSGATGFEVGWRYTENLKFYVATSWMFDVTTSDVEDRAKIIADAIGGTAEMSQSAAGVDFGARYAFATGGSFTPFALAGFGFATLNTDPTFIVNGQDVTDDLLNLGARLGLDLDSEVTRPYFVIGGGVTVPVSSRYFVEGGWRYGLIFAGDPIAGDAGVNTNRLQVSFGARF